MGKLIRRMGIPTFAVSALLLVVLIAAYVMGQSLPVLFTDILRRVGMNGILVLAMVPSIKSGVGPNFALPIGIVGGLFALMCCMQLDLMGWSLIGCSILLAIIICGLMGWAYGKLMNAVKGAEMTIATYTGFSIVAFFNILWLSLPFSNRKMGWMLGDGLRETIQMGRLCRGQDSFQLPVLQYRRSYHTYGHDIASAADLLRSQRVLQDQDRPRYLCGRRESKVRRGCRP